MFAPAWNGAPRLPVLAALLHGFILFTVLHEIYKKKSVGCATNNQEERKKLHGHNWQRVSKHSDHLFFTLRLRVPTANVPQTKMNVV